MESNATLTRCAWVGDDPLYRAYHDHEWGVPGEYGIRAKTRETRLWGQVRHFLDWQCIPVPDLNKNRQGICAPARFLIFWEECQKV